MRSAHSATCGEPLGGALVEAWHASPSGCYSIWEECPDAATPSGWGFRGATRADADGRWELRTRVPGKYFPRPVHVHFKFTAYAEADAGSEGVERPLVTQLYLARDPDSVRVHPALVHAVAGGVAVFDVALAARAPPASPPPSPPPSQPSSQPPLGCARESSKKACKAAAACSWTKGACADTPCKMLTSKRKCREAGQRCAYTKKSKKRKKSKKAKNKKKKSKKRCRNARP